MDETLTSRGKILYQSANVAEFFWRQNTIEAQDPLEIQSIMKVSIFIFMSGNQTAQV